MTEMHVTDLPDLDFLYKEGYDAYIPTPTWRVVKAIIAHINYLESRSSEHDRQVAERAWDGGYTFGLTRNGYHGPDMNPYRKERS